MSNKKAVVINTAVRRYLARKKYRRAKEALKADAKTLGDKIDEIPITVAKKAGDDDRLFGSVTNRDIEASLAALGHTVDRRRIILKEPIKSLGIYAVPVKLHADVTSHVKVWVCAL